MAPRVVFQCCLDRWFDENVLGGRFTGFGGDVDDVHNTAHDMLQYKNLTHEQDTVVHVTHRYAVVCSKALFEALRSAPSTGFCANVTTTTHTQRYILVFLRTTRKLAMWLMCTSACLD